MEGKVGCFSKKVVAILATKMSECLLGGCVCGCVCCMLEVEAKDEAYVSAQVAPRQQGGLRKKPRVGVTSLACNAI